MSWLADGLAAGWPYLTTAVGLVLALVASGHALLRKREVRASIGWLVLIWAVPIAGAMLYAAFGINRLSRQAFRRQPERLPPDATTDDATAPPTRLPAAFDDLVPLARLVERVTERPLLAGNRIEPLDGGDEAYPAMLEAIDDARRTVAMSTYIFDTDEAGKRFADALVAAKARGVEVRVLIDGVGAKYSRPSMLRVLRRRGLRAEAFLSSLMPWWLPYANLRNHRKLLIVDGRVGFTGGMNVRGDCVAAPGSERTIDDLHFRLEGPVVAQLMDAFAEDWTFTTGERLGSSDRHPPPERSGEALARAVPDGPDEHLDKLRWTLLGAVAAARERIGIVTPYFLPDGALQSALATAAMRGVTVDVVLPAINNLRFVQWAQTAELWLLLARGVRVWLTPPPFDHGKLMVVDDKWSCIGSSNWDPRSLRLNFELNVECYDGALARELTRRLDDRIARARRYTSRDLEARPLPVQLRDGIARLFTPYL